MIFCEGYFGELIPAIDTAPPIVRNARHPLTMCVKTLRALFPRPVAPARDLAVWREVLSVAYLAKLLRVFCPISLVMLSTLLAVLLSPLTISGVAAVAIGLVVLSSLSQYAFAVAQIPFALRPLFLGHGRNCKAK